MASMPSACPAWAGTVLPPRGNNEAVKTRFDPPAEHLAFHPNEEGEADIPVVFTDPLPIVIDAF